MLVQKGGAKLSSIHHKVQYLLLHYATDASHKYVNYVTLSGSFLKRYIRCHLSLSLLPRYKSVQISQRGRRPARWGLASVPHFSQTELGKIFIINT